MKKNSVIKKTGQAWKWYAGNSLLIFSYILLAINGVLGFLKKSDEISYMITMLGFLIIYLSAEIYLWTSIKCPLCKSRWLWLEVSKRDIFKKWGPSITDQEICPECKDTGIIKKTIIKRTKIEI